MVVPLRRRRMPCPSPWGARRPSAASVRLVALALLLGSTTGCAAGGPSHPPAGQAGPLAQRHTWGGMCAEGACFTTLTVTADGTWTYEDEAGSGRGRLEPRQLERVLSAVGSTRLGAATAGDVGCQADLDGTSVRLGWASPDGWTAVSSCEVSIDSGDPLVEELGNLEARLVP